MLTKSPFWRYDVSQKNLLMSSYHLHAKNLGHYYRKIIEFSPKEIFAYPSSLEVIADYILRQGLPPIELSLVMTTAEALHPYQRDKIQIFLL